MKNQAQPAITFSLANGDPIDLILYDHINWEEMNAFGEDEDEQDIANDGEVFVTARAEEIIGAWLRKRYTELGYLPQGETINFGPLFNGVSGTMVLQDLTTKIRGKYNHIHANYKLNLL